MRSVRLPAGMVVCIRGMRNEPMKAIPKIITGKSANERLPNLVEWTRHSSFIMFLKSSSMVILPDKREEEGREMFPPSGQVGNGAGMQEFSLVEDRKLRTDLFGHFEDVGRDEDRPAFLHVPDKELLDQVLHDRVEVDQRLIDQGKGGLVDECLREHQFLSGAPGEVLAEHVLLVRKVKVIEPEVCFFVDLRDLPDCSNKLQVLYCGQETGRGLLLRYDPHTGPHPDRVTDHFHSEHGRRAAGRFRLAGEHLDHRGLAGAVWAQQAKERSLFHREGHVVDCLYIAIGF